LSQALTPEPATDAWTDLSRLEGPGIRIVLDEGAPRTLGVLRPDALPMGGRRLFRAALRGGASRLDVVLAGIRIGTVEAADAAPYARVLSELARGGREAVCSGYLLARAGGAFEARLLLHEPDECQRRVELDRSAAEAGSIH
jgi:hypothetical protein